MSKKEKMKLPFLVQLPEHTKHINMIVYGETGVGKTQLCGTALDCEETTPALLIDFEGGTRTLHGSKIHVTRPRSWKDIQVVHDFLRYENDMYRCVIIDPLTELQRRHSMGSILGELMEDDVSYKSLEEANVPTRQDWLKSGEQMRKVIRAFRDLAYLEDEERRCHVIMTALEKYDEKKRVICPQLPGQLGLECGAFVDVLARLSKVTKEGEDGIVEYRHLLIDGYTDEYDVRYLAKKRSMKTGKAVWNPTIEKLLQTFQEATAEETPAPVQEEETAEEKSEDE